MRQEELIDPFGQADCEAEVRELKNGYRTIFFDEAPFNDRALDPTSYLISGRRGSGKTALAKYFSFQARFPGAHLLEIDGLEGYEGVLREVFALSERVSDSRQFAIQHIVKIWEVIIWALIVRELAPHALASAGFKDLPQPIPQPGSLDWLIRGVRELLVSDDKPLSRQRLAEVTSGEHFGEAKDCVYRICAKKQLIITVDTLEQYEVDNRGVMFAIAALIDFAAVFNSMNRDRGLHLKIFVAGEILPHLTESVILNPLKSIKHPVYLLWRPRDLLRLICWRLYRRLGGLGQLCDESGEIKNWEKYKEVREKMWVPYFGEIIPNKHGRMESSFIYVLRHTQMRPRQVISLCNAIANRAIRAGRFPRFSPEDVQEGIWQQEDELAAEIINSYSSVYPNAAKILGALSGLPMTFKGSKLDQVAKLSTSHWPHGLYSLANFRQLVSEMGVVGRVKQKSSDGSILEAEFDYATPRRLYLNSEDECVIHPMFYQRFNVSGDGSLLVLPFSRDPEVL